MFRFEPRLYNLGTQDRFKYSQYTEAKDSRHKHLLFATHLKPPHNWLRETENKEIHHHVDAAHDCPAFDYIKIGRVRQPWFPLCFNRVICKD